MQHLITLLRPLETLLTCVASVPKGQGVDNLQRQVDTTTVYCLLYLETSGHYYCLLSTVSRDKWTDQQMTARKQRKGKEIQIFYSRHLSLFLSFTPLVPHPFAHTLLHPFTFTSTHSFILSCSYYFTVQRQFKLLFINLNPQKHCYPF